MEWGWPKMKQGKKWSLCSTNMSSHPHFLINQSLGLSSVSPSALYLISLASATKAHLILHCTSFPLALCSNTPLVVLGYGPWGPARFLRWERESGRQLVPGSLSSSSGLSKAHCSQSIFSRPAFTVVFYDVQCFLDRLYLQCCTWSSFVSAMWYYHNYYMLEGAEWTWKRWGHEISQLRLLGRNVSCGVLQFNIEMIWDRRLRVVQQCSLFQSRLKFRLFLGFPNPKTYMLIKFSPKVRFLQKSLSTLKKHHFLTNFLTPQWNRIVNQV